MKKLLIDVGNSRTKWAFLDTSTINGQLTKMLSYSYEGTTPLKIISKILEQQQYNINEIIMVSVLGDEYIASVKELTENAKLAFFHVQSSSTLAGISNAYHEPHKLGADRLVAIGAAYHLNMNQASLIIDSGTATTIDAVDDNGHHLGGVILPGLDLCSQSLLSNTEMLAEFNKSDERLEPSIFSTDTKQAIASGSLFGLVGAINNICLQMETEITQKNHRNSINKVICGGSAYKLLPHLDKSFKHQENLLMHGLKIISEQKTN